MSESVKLGKVSMTLGGDYSSSQAYDKLTCVQYDGRSWVSRKQVPAGVAPTEANSAYWQKISERGVQGPQGQSYVDKELVPIVNDLTTGGSSNVLSAEQGKVLDGKLAELSEESVKINDTEIPLGAAYNPIPVSLKKGQVIESIGNAGQLIFGKEDGTEDRISSSDLPYILPFNVVSVIPTSNATGSKVIAKNLIDSKLNAFSSELKGIEGRMAIASEGVTIPIANKNYRPIELPIPLKAGMIIESIADAEGVYLRNLQGEDTLVRASAIPYTIQEDVYAVTPISNATGDMIVKSYVDSKFEGIDNGIVTLDGRVNFLENNLSNYIDTEIPLGAAHNPIPVSLKAGMIIESIADAEGVYLRNLQGEDTLVRASAIPYTIQEDVYAVIPTSNATGSALVIKNIAETQINTILSDVSNLKSNQDFANEGLSISLADRYYKPIDLSRPLRAGMIIESIADAEGVYLRNEQGEETYYLADVFPYAIQEDIYAVIPTSRATGNMIVKSYVDSKFVEIEERLAFPKSDLSNESHIIIPLPTSLARVNISASRFPTSKNDEITGFIEFYDRSGNYFRKPIEALAWQGSTSLAAPKKNLKFDFSDCTMKVGNWVTQDSFHLKSNYFDVFRGKSNLAYDLWRKIIEYNRPQEYRTPYINASEYSWYDGKNNMSDDFNEARLTPAGFPVELYFNGEYQGIYTWNIKKDRANYAMDKKKSNNIHIDSLHIQQLLTGERLIWEEMEIRNPKSLVTMDGSEYDGDAPTELIDSSASAYDSSNADHKRSAEVKANIVALFNACADVMSKRDKVTFEKYFDKDWFIDLHIWGNAILDGDGLSRNTQYLYWGNKWYPTPYDCDQIYGNSWRGNQIYRKSKRVVDSYIYGKGLGIYDVFLTLYAADIEARYAELREANIVSPNAIIAQISQYVDLIGKEAFEKEFELWNETPSYREPNDNPQWKYEGDYYEGDISEWNDSSAYKVGEYVYVVIEGDQYYWKCLEANTGVRPYTDKYKNTPIVGGIFDGLTRTEKWLKVRFEFLDNYYHL